MKAWWLLFAALALAACSTDDDGSSPAPPRYRIPGCEAYDTAPCDVRQRNCDERLMRIAVCLRQDQPAELPPITVMSEADFAALVRADALAAEPSPHLHEYDVGLSLLHLIQRGALEAEAAGESTLDAPAGVYRFDHKDVIIVDHGEDTNTETSSDVLVHEFVHALQDRELDLMSWGNDYPATFDTSLALRSMIEGEARFHELRYRASMVGLDPKRVDWPSAFQKTIEMTKEWIETQPSVLLAGRQQFPYAWGARFFGVDWDRSGQAGVRASFADPPTTTHALMASVDARVKDDFSPATLTSPTPPDGIDLISTESLGALGTYLLVSHVTDGRVGWPDPYSAAALAWRGDRLSLYSAANPLAPPGTTDEKPYTAVVWAAEFATSDAANEAAALIQNTPGGYARVFDNQVIMATSDANLPMSWAFPSP